MQRGGFGTNTGTLGSTLRDRLGDIVSTTPEDLERHGRDEGYEQEFPPECVVYARNKEDVLRTLEVAREYRVPVTPFGAGSGLEGNALPVKSGISLDMTGMNRVVNIDPDSLYVIVEPGVLHPQLNRELRPHGLFFSVDPGAEASLGSMAGTNASGANALRYGAMRDQVLELEVALADGRVIRVGSKARKSSSGYDLKDLFIGSEGTLGIITELAVKVYPVPAHSVSLRAVFPDLDSAVRAATELAQTALNLARLELVDEECVRAVNGYESTDYPEKPTLWIEIVGSSEAVVEEEMGVAERLCREAGAEDLTAAHDEEEQERLWEARHHAWYAVDDAYPEDHMISTDICVPIAGLAEAIDTTQRLLEEHALSAPIIGHAGDGNYHLFFHLSSEDEDGWRRFERVMEGMTAKALGLGGTCTGEHGVGLRKIKDQESEHGEALSVMQEVKQMLDPPGLLNPGKVLPDPQG
ncbi:MAG: FAD-binding protein [Actinomycetota bacterium]|nr:FAD-binding protein [Actinomycetota bacterium]